MTAADPCSDPFGALPSLVLRDLFLQSESAAKPEAVSMAGIARRTGLDLVIVASVIRRLSYHGYVSRRRDLVTFLDPARALDLWTGRWGRGERVMVSYEVGMAWSKFVPALGVLWRRVYWAWTGVAGAVMAGAVSGTPLHRVCYVAGEQLRGACQRLQLGMDCVRVEHGGTFHVIAPREVRAELYGVRATAGGHGHVVSTVQLALDVAGGPDARAAGVAKPVLEVLRGHLCSGMATTSGA